MACQKDKKNLDEIEKIETIKQEQVDAEKRMLTITSEAFSKRKTKKQKTKEQIYEDAIKEIYDNILGISPKKGKDAEKDKK